MVCVCAFVSACARECARLRGRLVLGTLRKVLGSGRPSNPAQATYDGQGASWAFRLGGPAEQRAGRVGQQRRGAVDVAHPGSPT
eukprot:11915006-Alexandrium_andersonii.AAC.1